MDDIISNVPWPCGFVDGCTAGWHKASYWVYGDGSYSVDKYSDGDHDPCDESDLPSASDEVEAWRSYWSYVAESGKDPIAEFVIPSLPPTKRQWQARVRNWIGADKHGLKVSGVRRRGRGPWIAPSEAPPIVREYLGLDELDAMGVDFRSLKDLEVGLCVVSSKSDLESWIDFEVDEPRKPWSEGRVAAYLKSAARKALRTK